MTNRTYRTLARETRRALARPAALIGRTDDPDRIGEAERAAADAAGTARYLAAHAVGIDPAAFLRECGMLADARRYDPPARPMSDSEREWIAQALRRGAPIPGATVRR